MIPLPQAEGFFLIADLLDLWISPMGCFKMASSLLTSEKDRGEKEKK
jgi:hypothetical protein